MRLWRLVTFALLSLFICVDIFAICPENLDGIIWKGKETSLSFQELAAYAAPMLWFSPDEPLLCKKYNDKPIPEPFPFETADKPVVYFKIKTLYAENKTLLKQELGFKDHEDQIIDLKTVRAIDLNYYYYFSKDIGLGTHPHDIEYITLQMQVVQTLDCPDYDYAIAVKTVIAKAHGLIWYQNILDVDDQTFFPLSILIEEGKHASCTDQNADGEFTPGYDVTRRINDAWGIRDIITTGKLFSGKFQAWMAKRREPEDIVFPPIPKTHPNYDEFMKKFGEFAENAVYELRSYPEFPREDIDDDLTRFMRSKRPHKWPQISTVIEDGAAQMWAKEEKIYRQVSLAYRYDGTNNVSISIPFFIVKSLEAPMTGGWIYHKLYFGDLNLIRNSKANYFKIFGHQFVHSPSASRWLDTYIGLGYEFHEVNTNPEKSKYDIFFVSEAGIKMRLNINNTPFKFLRHLGTDFWGIKMGWKNVGLHPFIESGFVIEVGAGAF